MINWQYYPKSDVAPQIVATTIAAFESVATQISSESNTLESNAVLEILANKLTLAGFLVETGKTKEGKVRVPVLFGRNGRLEKSFDADAYHRDEGFVLKLRPGVVLSTISFSKTCFRRA